MEHIRILFRWRSERFPSVRYGPFALILGVPALGFQASPWFLWTLSLLLQLRLRDDIASRERDRINHPERVLSQSRSRSPSVFFLVLSTMNLGFILNRGLPPLVLYLLFLLLLHGRFPVFGKYAVLVLAVDTVARPWSWEILLHGILVGVAASAFELGHDPFASGISRLFYAALVVLPCLGMFWTPIWLSSLIVLTSGLGLLRLQLSSWRFLSSAMPHVSVALIAGFLFH